LSKHIVLSQLKPHIFCPSAPQIAPAKTQFYHTA
jgi:hypothetical protein